MSTELSGTVDHRLITPQSPSVGEVSPSSTHRRHASFSSGEGSPVERRDMSEYAYSPPASQASPVMSNPTTYPIHDDAPELPKVAKELSQQQLLPCGADPKIQKAARAILESQAYQDHKELPFDSIRPFLKPCGKGKRGAATSYRCLWGGCGTLIPRKLHAKEHIMAHINHRPHVCDDWYVQNYMRLFAYL